MVTQEQWQEAYLKDCLQRHREEVRAMKNGKGSKGSKGSKGGKGGMGMGKGKPC